MRSQETGAAHRTEPPQHRRGAGMTAVTIDRSSCNAVRHGYPSAYTYDRCRCPDAREATRVYRKRLREGRSEPALIDATGTARRLQSLAASGYTQAAIAQHLGKHPRRIGMLMNKADATVTRGTAEMIRKMFRDLDGTDGGNRYAKTAAKRNGWVDAAAWDNIDDPTEQPKLGDPRAEVADPVLAERVLAGATAQLTPADRRIAVALGRQRGMPLEAISKRIKVSWATARQLERDLQAA